MAKQKRKTTKRSKTSESDSTFFLKIILFFILGTGWVRIGYGNASDLKELSLPVGLVVGLVFASHEHFQIDRKIEFAILLAVTFISFYLPTGITI